MVEVLVVVLFATCSGVLVVARRRGRLVAASMMLLAVALGVWALTAVAIVGDVGDADAFVDCGDDCSPAHYATAVGFLAPPLLAALAGVGLLVAIVDRALRRRREGA